MHRKYAGSEGTPFLNFEGGNDTVENGSENEVQHEPITKDAIIGALQRTLGYNPYSNSLPPAQLVARQDARGSYVFRYNSGKSLLPYEALTECNQLLKTIDVDAVLEAARNRKPALPVQELSDVDVKDDNDDDEKRGYERDDWGGINYK